MVDGIEDELLAAGDASDAVLDSLFHLNHELTALRRLAVPLRDVVSVLMKPTTWLMPEESRAYYDDVRDHLLDRKSTRLNSSHANISYAVFFLKKNKTTSLRYSVFYTDNL